MSPFLAALNNGVLPFVSRLSSIFVACGPDDTESDRRRGSNGDPEVKLHDDG